MTNTSVAERPTDLVPKSGLVWLASYPKSGNTWARVFLANLAALMAGEREEPALDELGRFTVGENFTSDYSARLGFEPTGTEDHRQRIAAARHDVQREIADRYEGLVFVKTHNALLVDRGHALVNFAVTSGAIYMVRNPLDVAISLAHHLGKSVDETIEIMSAPKLETEVTSRRVHEIWSSWSGHVQSWTRKPHRAIHVMRYEDMLADPLTAFGALAAHLVLSPSPSELAAAVERASFDRLREREARSGFREKPAHADSFFREGRAGQWKAGLSSAQIARIVRDHGEQMARFGYLPD